MPSESPVKTRAYVGLFFVALSTVMYEILLTRIFSVTMLYHFAFVALSVAMFGMTVGALLVYLLPRVFTADRVADWIALAAVALPVAMVLSFLTQLSIPFRVAPTVVALYAIVFTYAVIAVPFVVAGIVTCLALTGYPSRVSRLYAADLAGAAVGCALLIPVLDQSDGPTAVLWVAALASLGSIAFARQSRWNLRRPAALVAIAMFVCAGANTVLVWRYRPLFRIIYVKANYEARPLYEKWNSYSRVRVNGNVNEPVKPQGWGLSSTLPPDLRVHQLQMDIDVVAGTVMTEYHGDPASVPHLRYDITNLGYRIRPNGDALVIGAGGGRDVLSALTSGARSVTAVEINKDILKTVNGKFGDFTGHLDRDPRVHFVNDEARSYIARSADRYGLMQISLIDTWASTAAGAFVLSENSIYTAEAWTTFLQHLTPDGMLSVSRWYFRDSPAEMYRSAALAAEALRRVGIADPRPHIVIARNMTLANKSGDTPDGVGTMLVSMRPFTDAELAEVTRVCDDLKFDVMLTPQSSRDSVFDQVLGPRSVAFISSFPLRINAPTDDSPFFFNMLRWKDMLRPSSYDQGKQSANLAAVATLGVLLATVTGLTILCILLPLWFSRRPDTRGAGSLFAFFIAIGLGFMLIETSQMQRLIILLGHPTYALSVVLFALLLSSGAGSYLTSGVPADRLAASGAVRLSGLVAVLIAFGIVTPWILTAAASASTPIRIAAAVGVLFPAGLMMGMAFPLGMKLAAERKAALTSWLWGLNGAASVLASVLSICIALTWSISAAFWTGCAIYLGALAAFRRASA